MVKIYDVYNFLDVLHIRYILNYNLHDRNTDKGNIRFRRRITF